MIELERCKHSPAFETSPPRLSAPWKLGNLGTCDLGVRRPTRAVCARPRVRVGPLAGRKRLLDGLKAACDPHTRCVWLRRALHKSGVVTHQQSAFRCSRQTLKVRQARTVMASCVRSHMRGGVIPAANVAPLWQSSWAERREMVTAGNFRVSSFRASGHDLDNAVLMIHYIHSIIEKLL